MSMYYHEHFSIIDNQFKISGNNVVIFFFFNVENYLENQKDTYTNNKLFTYSVRQLLYKLYTPINLFYYNKYCYIFCILVKQKKKNCINNNLPIFILFLLCKVNYDDKCLPQLADSCFNKLSKSLDCYEYAICEEPKTFCE